MPPIDGKVTKVKRRSTNALARYVDNLKIKMKKDKAVRQVKGQDYMAAMRKMQKKSADKAKKTADPKKNTSHPIKQPANKSQQKNNKQGTKG